MDDFIEKLKKLIANEGLTASKFAEKIGVQRSSVSHVLSGRNKPSLDFILKINKSISSVSLDWLLSNENEPIQNSTLNSEINSIENIEDKSEVEKIIIFFKNGSFKIHKNQ
jgi:transcriptional regulator with XRE-family HTH domain